jgi:hypothetical protein
LLTVTFTASKPQAGESVSETPSVPGDGELELLHPGIISTEIRRIAANHTLYAILNNIPLVRI